MARQGGKDRGIVFKEDSWWVRLVYHQRERWHKCDSKSQARARYQRLKADIREERYFPEKFATKQDVTVRAWIARCLDGSTNRGYVNDRRYARRWSAWFGNRRLQDLSIEELRHHQAKLRAKMKPLVQASLPTRRWSDATINRHFAFLRHVLTLAVKDGKLNRNPVSAIKFFAEAQRTRFLSDQELQRLEQVMAPHDWQLVLFAVETGLRRAEQFRLRWDHVNLETGLITIPLPKGGRTRHVPLSAHAQAMVRSLDSFTRSPWVFPAPKTPLRSWNPQSFVNNVYSVALRKAGITGVNWHALRHTAASRRIMAGADLVSVKEILGHRDIQTTMRYSHLSPAHLRQAVNMGSLADHLRTISPPNIQVGTGSKTGSGATHEAAATPMTFTQVVDRIGGIAWLAGQDSPLSSQFKNPKSKQAPIVRFLDKEHPHC